MAPRGGALSRYWMTRSPLAARYPTISAAKPAVGRVPRNTPTTISLEKSTAGRGRLAACSCHNAVHASWSWIVTCRATTISLLVPLSRERTGGTTACKTASATNSVTPIIIKQVWRRERAASLGLRTDDCIGNPELHLSIGGWIITDSRTGLHLQDVQAGRHTRKRYAGGIAISPVLTLQL